MNQNKFLCDLFSIVAKLHFYYIFWWQITLSNGNIQFKWHFYPAATPCFSPLPLFSLQQSSGYSQRTNIFKLLNGYRWTINDSTHKQSSQWMVLPSGHKLNSFCKTWLLDLHSLQYSVGSNSKHLTAGESTTELGNLNKIYHLYKAGHLCGFATLCNEIKASLITLAWIPTHLPGMAGMLPTMS